MTRVAWLTCRVLPEPDPDEAPAIAALRAAGLAVEKLAWDDPEAADPGGFALCLLRSCWNYYGDVEAFRRWIRRVAGRSRLLNGPAVVRWNLHKAYLRALHGGGVPIVPTLWLERGTPVDLAARTREQGWRAVVVKPCVSAASFCTRPFGPGEEGAAQAFLDRALAERDMLVQELVPSVATSGERALVWIAGEFTHAVVKQPRFAGEDESVSDALAAGDEEVALGTRALDLAREDGGFDRTELLYARVDTVEHRGRRVVSELELLEPSLFLLQSPPALERFVQAVVERCGIEGSRP